MATRRETLVGGLSLITMAACRAPLPGDTGLGTTGTTGSDGGGGGSGGTTPEPTGTTGDTATTNPGCTSAIGSQEIVMCLADYPALGNVDGSAVLSATVKGKLIVVRVSETEAVTLSDVCTHAGCLVGWRASEGVLYCPCHGSKFATDGSVVAGPAGSPLATYETVISSDAITITL